VTLPGQGGVEIACYLTGIHPRSERLVQLTRDLDRRRATESEVEDQSLKDARALIERQRELGFTYLIDGLLNWQDLLRPFTTGMEGIELGPLARWFNNNTFYRKPVVTGRIRQRDRIIRPGRELRLDLFPSGSKIKAVIPAPFSFARLSDDRFYRDRTRLMVDYAEILNGEARELVREGVSYIQFSDPSLVYRGRGEPVDRAAIRDARDSMQVATEGLKCETCLQTYFGDCSRIISDLLDFPIGWIGIDFYETRIEALADYAIEKGIACGCVDGRNSLVEPVEQIASFASAVAQELELERMIICPNCDLEFLPLKVAERKMENIAISARRLRPGA